MSDRELLELAAKAAGIEWYGYFGDDEVDCQYLDIGADGVVEWNPLTDDGDALRLAVKLGFINPGQWPCPGFREADKMLSETGTVDWYAATRRAIVRAAAEIGRTL